MVRRSIAVLAILALAATIVPSGLEAAAAALACCNGIMCPMHAAQTHAPDCGMDMKGSSAELKPCPVQAAAHYTAAVVFMLLAPTILHNDAQSTSAIAFVPNFSPDAELRVDSPPPRLPLTA
jgi:hypothetical protein